MTTIMLYNALSLLAKQNKQAQLQQPFIPFDTTNNSFCRICLQEKGSAPLFHNKCRPNIRKDIHCFTGVKMKSSGKKSNVICQNCLDLLDGCIKFRKMCRKNNKKFKKIKQYSPVNENAVIQQDLDDDIDFIFDDMDSRPLVNEIKQELEYSNVLSPPSEEVFKNTWDCKYCKKEFTNWKQYNNHLPCELPTVKKKSKYKYEKQSSLCDVCGKVFTSAQILIGHKATHSDVFAYKCAKCPYESRYRAYLVIHMRSHMAKSERPYKCALCPSTAITASNLASHVRRVHSTERPFKCTSCEKTFRCKSDLASHTRLVHLRKMTVECSICYKTFNSKKYLKSHNWKVHKIKPEKSNLPNKLPSYIQYRTKMEEENYANHMDSLHTITNREDIHYNEPLL